jgi:hypothetical protein
MTREFSLKISLGNNAMRTSEHIATALHKIANRIDGMSAFDENSGTISDENGNKVGRWSIDEWGIPE